MDLPLFAFLVFVGWLLQDAVLGGGSAGEGDADGDRRRDGGGR